MMTATATETPLMAKFRQVYADAVVGHPENGSEANMRKRTLQWRHERPVTLQEAADAYGQIFDSYNEFKPNMIADLYGAFTDCGIEATPARVSSVGIFLHVPDLSDLRQRVEAFVQAHFNADEIDWQNDSGTLRVWWD